MSHAWRLRDQLLPPGAYDDAQKLAANDPALAERLANVSLGCYRMKHRPRSSWNICSPTARTRLATPICTMPLAIFRPVKLEPDL